MCGFQKLNMSLWSAVIQSQRLARDTPSEFHRNVYYYAWTQFRRGWDLPAGNRTPKQRSRATWRSRCTRTRGGGTPISATPGASGEPVERVSNPHRLQEPSHNFFRRNKIKMALFIFHSKWWEIAVYGQSHNFALFEFIQSSTHAKEKYIGFQR